MDVNYDNCFFELHNAVIKGVSVTEDSIFLNCVFMGRERVCAVFHTPSAVGQLPGLKGHTINYISVDEDGYKLYLLDYKDVITIKANSYSVEWG